MTFLFSIDDTDIPGSRGTGRLAREIADELASEHIISGVTRHQLLVHPQVPYTSHNSCAVIHISGTNDTSRQEIIATAREIILGNFIEGSDPGICLASPAQVSRAVTLFGLAAKKEPVSQIQARRIAAESGILLEGLGGTNDGVIGALAGIGLAASGNDGRFVQKGDLRQIRGRRQISELLAAGIDRVMTSDGAAVTEGFVTFAKFPKPALREGRAVLFVTGSDESWQDMVVG